MTTTTETLKDAAIHEIAEMIRQDWKNVNYAAVPYLQTMFTLDNITDNYYADSGRSVVNYFLANAQTWRGETAKIVKTELNRRLKLR